MNKEILQETSNKEKQLFTAERPLLSDYNKNFLSLISHTPLGHIKELAELLMSPYFNLNLPTLLQDENLSEERKAFSEILKGIDKGTWSQFEVLNDISQLYGALFVHEQNDEKKRATEKADGHAWEQNILQFIQEKTKAIKSEDGPDTHETKKKEGDAKYKIEFSQTDYTSGPNEEILKITTKENGEEKTYETHWPKGGVQLFDPQTREKKEFYSSEKIKSMYEDFLKTDPPYQSLSKITLRELSASIKKNKK